VRNHTAVYGFLVILVGRFSPASLSMNERWAIIAGLAVNSGSALRKHRRLLPILALGASFRTRRCDIVESREE